MDPYPLDPPYARRTPCYWWDEKPRRPDPPSPEDQKRLEEWLAAWVKSAPPEDQKRLEEWLATWVKSAPPDDPKPEPQ